MRVVAVIAAGQSFVALMIGVDTPLAIVNSGAGPMVLGIAYSTWAIGRAGTGLLAGYWFDRRGPKTGLLVSFGVLAAVSFGYGLLLGPWSMVGLRLLQGASAGVYWTSMLALVGYNVPSGHRVRRLAVFNGCVAVGGMGGAVIGGWMVAREGFRMPFWTGSLIALALGGLVLLFLPQTLTSTPRSIHPAQSPPGLSAIWPLSVVGGLSQVPSFLSNAALPLELLRYHLGATALGIENAVLVLGNLMGQWTIFRHPQIILGKLSIMVLYGMGILAVLGTTDAVSGWNMMMCLAVIGTMVNLYSVVWTAAVQQREKSNDTGRATGILRATSDTMSAASYPLIGWAEVDPVMTGVVLAGFLGSGMFYVWRFFRPGSASRWPVPREM